MQEVGEERGRKGKREREKVGKVVGDYLRDYDKEWSGKMECRLCSSSCFLSLFPFPSFFLFFFRFPSLSIGWRCSPPFCLRHRDWARFGATLRDPHAGVSPSNKHLGLTFVLASIDCQLKRRTVVVPFASTGYFGLSVTRSAPFHQTRDRNYTAWIVSVIETKNIKNTGTYYQT